MSVDNDRQVETSADVLKSLVRHIEQLEVAVDQRTVIGQAQGSLMTRVDIDADTAIAYAVTCSGAQRVARTTGQRVDDSTENLSRSLMRSPRRACPASTERRGGRF